MGLLNPGDVLYTHSQRQVRVDRLLGGGGQGEVYRATMDGRPVAVKWYFTTWLDIDSELGDRLQRLAAIGTPSDLFLWPEDLVTSSGTQGFGYVMELREPRFKGLVDLLAGRIQASTPIISKVGFELANGFSLLHARGLCYRDVSYGNVAFDPTNGDVRICDNDNVGVNGRPCNIMGTPKFVAPEIVQKKGQPNIQSDQHSLAVLLFYMFHLHHPLEGKRVMRIRDDAAPKAQDFLYGSQALFIFDPQNKENEAVSKALDPDGLSGHNAVLNWPLYPALLRDKFTEAFTVGLHDPFRRVTDSKWKSTLLALMDITYPCRCGLDLFYDPQTVKDSGAPSCSNCGAVPKVPPRLGIKHAEDRSMVLMTQGRHLYPHHLDPRRALDLSVPLARVAAHPKQPGILGLKNLSNTPWSSTAQDGAKTIGPGQTLILNPDVRIQFGAAEGRVKY